MNKAIKIGGIALSVLLVLFIVVSVVSTPSLKKSKNLELGVTMNSATQGMDYPGSSMAADSSRSGKMMTSSYQESSAPDLAQTEKRIIKNGDLNLKVTSVDNIAVKISEIAKNNSGEVFASNLYQSANNVKSGTITVKTPMANFEKTFNDIKKVASLVLRESTSGQDVTEQYTDLKAQLSNRQAEEQSFVKILDQAQKIDDVLAVTRELARVRGNIEQLQGSIKYLEAQTDMSVISVSLTEDANITVVDSWRPLQVVKESFNALITNLQGFEDLIIRLIVIVIPFLLIWALVIWVIYVFGRKIFLKLKNRETNE